MFLTLPSLLPNVRFMQRRWEISRTVLVLGLIVGTWHATSNGCLLACWLICLLICLLACLPAPCSLASCQAHEVAMSSMGFRPTPFRVRCAFLLQLLCTKVFQVPFSVHSCLPKMTTPMSECCHFNPRKRKCLWSCLITKPTHICAVKAAKSFVANTYHASWLRIEGSCVTTVKRT